MGLGMLDRSQSVDWRIKYRFGKLILLESNDVRVLGWQIYSAEYKGTKLGLFSACSAAGKDQADERKAIVEETESKPDMEGIVLNIDESGIKLARGLSPEEYEEIKNESITKLHKEYVAGIRDNFRLIDLIYEGETEWEKGDELEDWLDGDIMEVFPERARAKKIVVKP